MIMVGENKIKLNRATMAKAVEMWVNDAIVRQNEHLRCTNVQFESGWFTATVEPIKVQK